MKSDKFPILLRYCWFGLNQEFRKKIQPIALTTVQFTVLRTIHDKLPQSINQSDLSKLISTNKNNISAIVKRLHALGYVKISANLFDKREKQISISETGIATYLFAKKKADELKLALFQNFKQSELISLSQSFKRISQKADSMK